MASRSGSDNRPGSLLQAKPLDRNVAQEVTKMVSGDIGVQMAHAPAAYFHEPTRLAPADNEASRPDNYAEITAGLKEPLAKEIKAWPLVHISSRATVFLPLQVRKGAFMSTRGDLASLRT
jgi:hypothetical protein